MKPRQKKALDAAVAVTFFDFAFMEAVPGRDRQTGKDDTGHIIEIDSPFPHPTRIRVALPAAVTDRILENLFPEPDSGHPRPILNDCLCELVNILAGHYFGELTGGAGRYTLELPVIRETASAAGEGRPRTYLTADSAFSVWVMDLPSNR